ncbi:DUF1833 family protein [Shewanella sp.]|uniref:DUF1833 family protein n=1 Tax=Shewanella sp. TaxID=50422 RepID=UPI003F2F5A19
MTVEEAYRRKLASNPEGEIALDTVEIYHPMLSKRFYFVRDIVPLTATLETGETVTFAPTAMSATRPSNSSDMDQNASFSFSDPDNLLDDELDRIPLDDSTYPTFTFRPYLLSDLSAPANRPVVYDAQKISQQKGVFTAAVGVPRLNNRGTGLIANPTDIPLLKGVLL